MPSTDDDAVRVLYVGGLYRSGSTLSSLLFGELDGHITIGELSSVFRNGLQLDTFCGCGQRFSACEFWNAVGRAAFGGWSGLDAAHALALQRRVDRTQKIPAMLSPWKPGSFERDLSEYRDILTRIYRAIRDISGAKVVVDSSKRPSFAYILQSSPGIDMTCAQTVRDPRGVAHSHAKKVRLAPSTGARDYMPQNKPYTIARRWITVNALIRRLQHLGVEVVTVRYEDLAADPIAELCRVAALQGLGPADIDSGIVTSEGLTMRGAHLVAGSRIRMTEGTMPIRLDEEWRTEMPARDRRLVSGLTIVSRPRYGYA